MKLNKRKIFIFETILKIMVDYEILFNDGERITIRNAIIDTKERVVKEDSDQKDFNFYPFENIKNYSYIWKKRSSRLYSNRKKSKIRGFAQTLPGF